MRLDDSYFPCQRVTGSPVIRRADNLSTHLIGSITLGLWVVQSVVSCAHVKVIAATRRNFQRSWLADAYLLLGANPSGGTGYARPYSAALSKRGHSTGPKCIVN